MGFLQIYGNKRARLRKFYAYIFSEQFFGENLCVKFPLLGSFVAINLKKPQSRKWLTCQSLKNFTLVIWKSFQVWVQWFTLILSHTLFHQISRNLVNDLTGELCQKCRQMNWARKLSWATAVNDLSWCIAGWASDWGKI